MTKIIPLICPRCGASVTRESRKCKYCGASFILVNDALQPARILVCPECGQELPRDSLLCLMCGKLLTKNSREIKKLEHLQRKIIDSQKELRESIPGYTRDRMNIEDGEYVFLNEKIGDQRYVITSQRIVTYDITRREETFEEVRFEDASDVNCYFRPGGFLGTARVMVIEIEMFDGRVALTAKATGETPDAYNQDKVSTTATRAFKIFEGRSKDFDVMLYKIKFKR